MGEIGRNLTDCDGVLLMDKRHLRHDRDSLLTAEFLALIGESGVKSVRISSESEPERMC